MYHNYNLQVFSIMNHQRFKFYKHSTEYYRQLSNSITHLEETCKDINYTVLPSTINYNRKSKFIKSNSNTNKSCLLYTSPSPRDKRQSRMPSSA